jgi:hypothetical protein
MQGCRLDVDKTVEVEREKGKETVCAEEGLEEVEYL